MESKLKIMILFCFYFIRIQKDLKNKYFVTGDWSQSRETEEDPRIHADGFVCFNRLRYTLKGLDTLVVFRRLLQGRQLL